MTDTTVEVKIAASLDPSLRASTAAAKAEIAGLSGSASGSAAALKAVAASEAEVTAATNAMSHGAISTAAREFRALFDELSSGRTRMTPGTLAIIAQRVYGLEASSLAAVAAVGAFAGAIGYATYQAFEAEKELERLASGFELTGRGASVSQGFIEQWVTSTWKIFDSTGETTKKIVALEAANGSLNATIINAANQVIPLFIKQYGDEAPKAMEHLLSSLGNLTVNGFKKLDKEMLNLSPTQYAAIENMIRTGHETEAATTILEALASRGGISIKSLQQNLEDLQAEAVKLRAGFLTDKDATDGLTLASQEYLRVLREIQGVKQASKNAPQQEADKTFKAELDLQEAINAKLTQRETLEKNLASLQDGLASARKIKNEDLINSFTQAITKQQAEIAAIDQREADKRFAKLKAENAKKLAEEKRANEAFLQDIVSTSNQIEQILQRDADAANAMGRSALANKKRDLDQAVSMRKMSSDEELQILVGLYSNEADLEIARLRAHQQANAEDVAIYDEDARKILEIYKWLFAEIDKLQTGSVSKQQQEINRLTKQYEKEFLPVTNGFNTMVRGMLSGNQTLVQSLRQGAAQMVEDFIMANLKKLESAIVTDLAITSASVTGDEARAAAHDAAASQGLAKDAAMGSAQIMNDAYKAAAGVYQSVAQIPYVGWILAPIAAGAAFTAVAAFDSLSSAEGGAWEVPGGLWQLHPEESVLPAHIANPMRDFFTNGGANGGGGQTININNTVAAIDGNSVVKTLKNRQTLRHMAKAYGAYMALNPSARGNY